MVEGVWSNEVHLQLEMTTQFRNLLSTGVCPPIEDVVKCGVVPRFVEFLAREDSPQLQFVAAWCLTNIAAWTSENIKVVIFHGAIPIFVKLLGSSDHDVREKAVCFLGNVADNSPKCRDFVFHHDGLLPLLAQTQLTEHGNLSIMRSATWALSNLCGGKPQPPLDQTKLALSALLRLLHSNDDEVLIDACWALSHLSDGTNDEIQAVIEAGVCPRLVALLIHPSPLVVSPALRTVGNIVTGDDTQTECIINHQVLPRLLILLTSNYKKSIKKKACLAISNITAGNKEQIQAVIEANIIGPLVRLLQYAEFDLKLEAARAILNASFGCTHQQIKYLASQGCIKQLCGLLACPDPRIGTVLKAGEDEKNLDRTGGVNLSVQMINDVAEVVENIKNLRIRDEWVIYEKASKILETYRLKKDLMPPGDASQPCFGSECVDHKSATVLRSHLH
ncbi:importin subunit alpha-1a-like [Cornus florida]|uniref:importin subunit alpha-1a-like n=1 Tax=Cornus florida TaxID=4283 RepID=UPI00289CCBDE|nr:importin subunit alpha-1a-like [Cornus florida]